MLNNNNSFAILLLPTQKDLVTLNRIKNKLYGPEYNAQPKNGNADAHITLGVGVQNDGVLKIIENDIKENTQLSKFSLNYSSISVQEIRNQSESYLWVGVIYKDKHLLELTGLVNKLLHKYCINLTDEYDLKLKGIYDESSTPKTLIGNHISLGNRCIAAKNEVIKKMLDKELPKEILIDHIAIKSFGRNEDYTWLHTLP